MAYGVDPGTDWNVNVLQSLDAFARAFDMVAQEIRDMKAMMGGAATKSLDISRELNDVVTQARVTGFESLTDLSGGVPSATIQAIGDPATRNAIASLATKVNALLLIRTFLARINI